MTVAEYIEHLQTLPQHLPVLVTDCPFSLDKHRTSCSNFRPAAMPHTLRVAAFNQDGHRCLVVQNSSDRSQEALEQFDAVRLA